MIGELFLKKRDIGLQALDVPQVFPELLSLALFDEAPKRVFLPVVGDLLAAGASDLRSLPEQLRSLLAVRRLAAHDLVLDGLVLLRDLAVGGLGKLLPHPGLVDVDLRDQLGSAHGVRRTGDDLAVLVVLRLDAHRGVGLGHRLRDLGLVDVETREVGGVHRHLLVAELLLGEPIDLAEGVEVRALLVDGPALHLQVSLERLVDLLHRPRGAIFSRERFAEATEAEHDRGQRLLRAAHVLEQAIRVELRVGDLLTLAVDLLQHPAELLLLAGL